jgi:hypothetical protein
MQTELEKFLQRYLQPPKGNSPEQVAARIRHWIRVANDPTSFVNGDTSSYAISAKRRTARQNIRRLLKNYPQVAEQVMRDDAMSEQVG